MIPLLFTVGDTTLRLSSLIFTALGLIIGAAVGSREYQRLGFESRSRNQFYWAIAMPLTFLISTISAFILSFKDANIFENLENAMLYGFSSFGAVLGVLLLGYIQSLIFHEPTAGKRLDFISSILPLSLGIYRIGCLLNGCCVGDVTDGPFGVYLPDAYGVWAYRYPAQIFLMLFDLGLFFWLWQRRKETPFDGSLTISFLIVFSVGRFLIDGIRDLPTALGPLSPHQLLSFCIFITALYAAYEFRNERRKKVKR